MWAEFEILTNPSVNSMTIVTDPWIPDESYDISITDIEQAKVQLWIENLDSQTAMTVGSSADDLVRAYLSVGGNETFTITLGFTEHDPEETYSGSNIYIHESDIVDNR